jgi:hypothetical protein
MAIIAHAHKTLMISNIKLMRFGRKSGTGAQEPETALLLIVQNNGYAGYTTPPQPRERCPREQIKRRRRCRVTIGFGTGFHGSTGQGD